MKILIALIAAAALAGCVGYVPYGAAGYAGGPSYGGSVYYGDGGAYYGNGGPYVVAPVPERRWGDGGYRRWRGHEEDRDRDRDFRRY